MKQSSFYLVLCSVVFLFISITASSQDKQSVYFKSPKNRAKVSETFKVKFGVRGMTIKPAGELAEGTGHHHLIIDSPVIPKGTPIPVDEKHIHFGKGQTETEIKLSPGKHVLSLQFADGAHLSYGPEMRATITVTVKESAK